VDLAQRSGNRGAQRLVSVCQMRGVLPVVDRRHGAHLHHAVDANRVFHSVQDHRDSHVRVSDHINLTDANMAADGVQIINVVMNAPASFERSLT